MLRRLVPFLIAAAVVLLDRVTKAAIKSHLGAYDTITVIPGLFNIVHTETLDLARAIDLDRAHDLALTQLHDTAILICEGYE